MKEQKQITELTPAQEAALEIYKNKWLDKLFKYELFLQSDSTKVEDYVKKLYKFCNLAEPEVFLLDSPMACQKKANELDNKKDTFEYYSFASYVSVSDFGWLAFYDYIINNLDIVIEEEHIQNFNLLKNTVENCFLSIQLDKYCMVSKYPNFISIDSENRMHNINDYAIKFCDGYGQHYFHGFYVKPELFEKLINKEYTFEDFSKEKNEEIKSMILAFYAEKFGDEFMFRFLSENLKEVDSYTDKKEAKYLKNTTKGMNLGVYTLFKGMLGDTLIAYVRCYCPSTDRMFFLGVEHSMEKAKDAVASLCQVPKVLKEHLISINRQGEIFSFNFDEAGTNLLKNNKITSKDLKEVIPLTGDEYFTLMKFEY